MKGKILPLWSPSTNFQSIMFSNQSTSYSKTMQNYFWWGWIVLCENNKVQQFFLHYSSLTCVFFSILPNHPENSQAFYSLTLLWYCPCNTINLRYADDTTLMAESIEELKSLMRVKEESEKAGLNLNYQKRISWWHLVPSFHGK